MANINYADLKAKLESGGGMDISPTDGGGGGGDAGGGGGGTGSDGGGGGGDEGDGDELTSAGV